MMDNDLAIKIGAMEEAAKGRDREIRDLKTSLSSANKKLDEMLLAIGKLVELPDKVTELTTAHDEAAGAIKLGKFIAGTSFFGLLGGFVYGIIHFFESIGK